MGREFDAGWVASEIDRLLVKHDLQGLLRMGAPGDEYWNEALMISDSLKIRHDLHTETHASKPFFTEDEVHGVVVTTFVLQFGLHLTGDPARYKSVACDIYNLVKDL